MLKEDGPNMGLILIKKNKNVVLPKHPHVQIYEKELSLFYSVVAKAIKELKN